MPVMPNIWQDLPAPLTFAPLGLCEADGDTGRIIQRKRIVLRGFGRDDDAAGDADVVEGHIR